MATIGSLSIRVDSEGCRESFASLAAALDRSSGLLDQLVEAGFGGIVLGDDLSGLFRCEPIDGVARGAGELCGLRVLPDERYIELVAAVTRDGDPYISGLLHGWPILSVDARTATVAGGGEAASLSPEGRGA